MIGHRQELRFGFLLPQVAKVSEDRIPAPQGQADTFPERVLRVLSGSVGAEQHFDGLPVVHVEGGVTIGDQGALD